MMIYDCPTHNQEFVEGRNQGCLVCKKILKRVEENSKVPKIKIRHLKPSVFWGKADELSSGRVIENLGHRPQYFRNKDQLRNFLKHNRIQEAG